jgi:hypothetical protein
MQKMDRKYDDILGARSRWPISRMIATYFLQGKVFGSFGMSKLAL